MTLSGDGVRLSWVLLDGDPLPVSVFAGIPPSRRPAVQCPVCSCPVVLRLGDHLAHHAAHRAGHACAVTAPESALHLNSKLHIAAQLRGRGGGGLRLSLPCARGGPGCLGAVVRPWLTGWDDVAVELAVGSHRPDIVLLRGGRPLGAIEVKVHNAVSAEKGAALLRQQTPWTEVLGTEDLVSWSAADPLPARHVQPGPPLRCAVCAHHAPPRVRSSSEASAWQHTLRRYSAHTIRARVFARSIPDAAERGPLVGPLLLYDRFYPHAPVRERGALLHVWSGGTLLLWDTLSGRDISRRLRSSPGDTLCAAGESHLRRLRGSWVVDVGGGWWDPMGVLESIPLLSSWAAAGVHHRWRARLPSQQRLGPEATPLDLVQYLLGTHLAALPSRWSWASSGWGRVSDARWRLWPTA